jgi:hypothetical protein
MPGAGRTAGASEQGPRHQPAAGLPLVAPLARGRQFSLIGTRVILPTAAETATDQAVRLWRDSYKNGDSERYRRVLRGDTATRSA